jgi:hypothetical protein
MPKSVVQPKYKVVYSYPVELQDHWEGQATSELLEKKPELKLPSEITVTINVPHVESMKKAKLDINDTSLVFEYPELYYLDLNLKYNVDQAKGSAKHDKTRKTLTIRVPVTGLTEDSQRAFEENFKAFEEKRQARIKELTFAEDITEGQATAILPADPIEDDFIMSETTADVPKIDNSKNTEQKNVEEEEENTTSKDEVARGRE